MRLARLLLLLPLCLCSLARASALPDLGEIDRSSLPVWEEQRLGDQIMQDVRRDPSFINDAEISTYINRLGQRLTANISKEESERKFNFFVLRNAAVNAFALPGGHIGIHSGLIAASRNEAELAGVLAHEISHVTYSHMARSMSHRGQSKMASMLALALAVMAASDGSDLAMGAAYASKAASLQSELNYSRDFEREADRFGLELLRKSGFDPVGMASFFERLQASARLYDDGTPGYLRTHPLTQERIADMHSRIGAAASTRAASSEDYFLVRGKLRAGDGAAGEAAAALAAQLANGVYENEVEVRFGLAHALLRDQRPEQAWFEVEALRRLKLQSPWIDTLAARVRMQVRDGDAALAILRDALRRHPGDIVLVCALVETNIAVGDKSRAQEALELLRQQLEVTPDAADLYSLQARSYALLGKRQAMHRAQAEYYLRQGRLADAVQQLELGVRANDGDFYEKSQVEARLNELRRRLHDEPGSRGVGRL